MSHPFGDLLAQSLHRKRGLSQSKLAAGILQSPSIITEMCQGKRLNGSQARERVVAIMGWLQQQGALDRLDEANALLNAAGMSPLQEREPAEASMIQKLAAQSAPNQHQAADTPPIPARSPQPTPRHNLPAQLTPFIGRAKQIAQLVQHAQTRRLLTLTGAGGVGKTRLALQVAIPLLDGFADGIWFVDLAPLSDPGSIVQRILDLFRLPEQPDRSPLASLTTYLNSKQMLLILDNCEHLIAACAELAEAILQNCPQVSLLATSREALNIGGESPWRVPSLTRPFVNPHWNGSSTTPQSQVLSKELLGFEAVALFVARAHTFRPDFALTADNAPAIAHICNRLDGIPLALEMAAARLNLFTVEELATRLDGAFDKRFQLLTSGVRTAPQRQQTLRATLEWSYELLTAKEQGLLVSLSVFSGGWTFAAAEEVTGCSLDLMAQLVNKSLVIADQQAGQTRYRLLETVRQFAAVKLDEAKQATAARHHHLRYYMDLAAGIEPHLRTGQQVAERYAQLEAEQNNLRTAINWALDSGEFSCGLRIVGALYDFWVARGYLREGQTQAERLLTHTATMKTVERACALLTAGGLAANQHNYHIAQSYLSESEALARELGSAGRLILSRVCIELSWTKLAFLDFAAAQRYGKEGLAWGQALDDPWMCGQALIVLGAIASDQGDYATTRQHLDSAIACVQPLGCTLVYGSALSNLGKLLGNLGDYQKAHAYLTQSVAIFDALGGRLEMAWSLLGLGDIAAAQLNRAEAEQYYGQSLTIQRELNNHSQAGNILASLGRLAQRESDDERCRELRQESLAMATKAEQYYNQALAIQQELNDDDHAGSTLASLGRLAQRQGDYGRSRELLQESLAIAIKMADRPLFADTLEAIASLTAAQGQAERAVRIFGAVEALLRKDNLLLKPVLQPLHDRQVSTLREQLGEATFITAWATGTAMKVDEVTALILND